MRLTKDNSLEILEGLLARSSAKTAMLVSKEGFNMVNAGDVSYFNTTALSALLAGMFSATREVATMVDEEHFSILLQQGTNRHLHISLIRDSVMMVVIFEDQQRIGKVRHEAQRATEMLVKVVDEQEKPTDSGTALRSPEFRQYAISLIDQIFSSK